MRDKCVLLRIQERSKKCTPLLNVPITNLATAETPEAVKYRILIESSKNNNNNKRWRKLSSL